MTVEAARFLPQDLIDRGAMRVPGLLPPGAQASLGERFELLADGAPGDRLDVATALAEPGIEIVRTHASPWFGTTVRVVRILLLDKRPDANWALGWHQDRTIAVRARHEVDGFGAWTVKRGIVHVAPPPELHARMLTARLHLDATDEGNGALLISPGSHRLGRIAESDIPATVERTGVAICNADAGDVWFYSTPILHASARAEAGRRRRVVQIDLAAFDLPGGLEWSA